MVSTYSDSTNCNCKDSYSLWLVINILQKKIQKPNCALFDEWKFQWVFTEEIDDDESGCGVGDVVVGGLAGEDSVDVAAAQQRQRNGITHCSVGKGPETAVP